MKKFWVFPAIFLFLAGQGLAAQTSNFPHVSQIRAEPRNNLIRLTWTDSPDARGPVYIFRSARPFSGAVPANIRPIVVRYGTQYYIDDTDDMENIYYFIAASDTSGQRYDVIIPNVNSAIINTARGFTPPVQSSASTAIAATESEAKPELIAGISNLRVRQDGEMVLITYNTSDQQRNTVIYRSMQPVRQPHDLLNAIVVQVGFGSQFEDYPVPGFPWYYTVVYEDEILTGSFEINPGVNTTVSEIIISDKLTELPSLQRIPLPVLTLSGAVADSYFLAGAERQIPLSEESEKMLRSTNAPQRAPLELKKPRVFAMDLQEPASGEESALFYIISEYFVQFKWDAARDNLRRYLSLPRSEEVRTRGRFYLGQTLYFTGNYREALFEFLAFRSFYPNEANSWIDAVLAAMAY